MSMYFDGSSYQASKRGPLSLNFNRHVNHSDFVPALHIHHLVLQLYFLFPALAEDDRVWNPWGEEFEREDIEGTLHHEVPNIVWNLKSEPRSTDFNQSADDNTNKVFHVEVWGKAAIGLSYMIKVINT